jgi:hypothetical protein
VIATERVSGYRIEGHAIVSVDERIAGPDGRTPATLHNDADWRRFQAALDASAVVVLGRLSHEANPNKNRRNRLVVSSSATGIEQRDDAWWWNPGEAPLADALRAAAPAGGIAAVTGGRLVFDLVLDRLDAFHLATVQGVRVPGGVPLFSAIGPGRSAGDVLTTAGLRPGPREILDAKAGVSLVTWRRAK